MRSKTLATAALAMAATLLLVGLADCKPAHAAYQPVVYASVSGWTHPSTRPAWIYIGQGGSPMVHTWTWSTWGPTYAYSKGTLWLNNCKPNCALGRNSYYAVGVTLSGRKTHAGVMYYSHMTWRAAGHNYTLNMGSNGYWR